MFSPDTVVNSPGPPHIVFIFSGFPATVSFTLREGPSFSLGETRNWTMSKEEVMITMLLSSL